MTIVKTVPRNVIPSSGNFGIVVTYNANVSAAQRVVIQQAVNEWNAILQSRGVNPASYPVSIRYQALGGRVGSTGVRITATGELVDADTAFDPGFTWFEDPTPADDSEFTGPTPPAGIDLLTVARHELGHAFGWIASARVQNLIANDVFDVSRLNIGMIAGDAQHSNPALHANDVMQPFIVDSVRRPIRLYPNGALIARAYQQQIPMHFVDPFGIGSQDGSATFPWHSFATAMSLTPLDIPLLLAPQFFNVVANQTFSTRHTIFSARGGATVRVP